MAALISELLHENATLELVSVESSGCKPLLTKNTYFELNGVNYWPSSGDWSCDFCGSSRVGFLNRCDRANSLDYLSSRKFSIACIICRMKIDRIEHLNAIGLALQESAAVVLIGPRQVGKTTLARQIGSTRGAIYLDLESPADLRKLSDASAFLNKLPGRLVVLDEVHRVPELFTELRGIIDERRRNGAPYAQFLLLGSASLDLIQQTSESLAGRVRYLELSPLNMLEVLSLGAAPDKLWLRGGFPESYLSNSDASSLRWRQGFIRSYLERDVPMFAPRMPSALIGRLWAMLATAQGTLLNASRLGQSLGVSANSVARYLDLLADLLLVRRLQPWSGNVNKRLVKTPKIYIRDSGLVHALLEIESLNHLLGHMVCGSSWEGFVIENLIQAAGALTPPLFYRTADGAEIDLLFERAGQPFIAVEVKRSSAPTVEQGFHRACDELGIVHRIVVAPVSDSYPIKKAQVHSLASAMVTIRALHGGQR